MLRAFFAITILAMPACKVGLNNARSDDGAEATDQEEASASDEGSITGAASAGDNLAGSGTQADPYTLEIYAGTSTGITLSTSGASSVSCSDSPSWVSPTGSTLDLAPPAGTSGDFDFSCQIGEEGKQAYFKITVTVAVFGLSGDSLSSESIATRSFAFSNSVDSGWSIEGTCVPGNGDVVLSGDLGAINLSTGYLEDETFTATCDDATFSFSLYPTASGTEPYVNSSYGGKNFTITQGSDSATTRLFLYPSGGGVVEASDATELASALTAANNQVVVLTADIDLSTISATNNWTPITNTNPYYFDGNDNAITNLHIDVASTLQAFLVGGDEIGVSNLTISGYVRGTTSVSLLVASMSGVIRHVEATPTVVATAAPPTVAGLVSTLRDGDILFQDINMPGGSITGSGFYAGGLFAHGGTWTRNRIVYEVVSQVDISGAVLYPAGGLVGSMNFQPTLIMTRSHVRNITMNVGAEGGGLVGTSVGPVNIRESSSSGSLTGDSGSAGGLVGHATISALTIADSFSTMTINAASNCGGLIGLTNNNHVVTNSYFSGDLIVGAGSDIGPIFGDTTNAPATATGLYYLGSATCTACDNFAFGTSRTDAQLKQASTFAGWDFDDIWQIDEGVSYPTLRN